MGMEEFTFGREDFLKLLKHVEEINDEEIDLLDLVERLWEKRNDIKFKRYFSNVYPLYDHQKKKDYHYDPYLMRDLLFLNHLGVIKKTENNQYRIDKNLILDIIRR